MVSTKNRSIPSLKKNKKLIARLAQIYLSEIDMEKPMFICHIGNRHNRFNLFVHGVYWKNSKGEKERKITMMMIEHLEHGKKVDMVLIMPEINENRIKCPLNFTYARKSKLDFKPEFFMTSKKTMNWDLLTKKLGEAIDNKRIIEYVVN